MSLGHVSYVYRRLLVDVLAERLKHKMPLEHERMRNLQSFIRKGHVVVKEHIEVDVPWPLVDELDAAHFVLDTLQGIKQGDWG
jgi:hypothetical protein